MHAKSNNIEYLGQPCRAKNILSTLMVTDPKTGKESFVLCSSSEAAHIELIVIDFENNTGQVFNAPTSEGAWALQLVSGNRLVIGTYYDGYFLVFDLNRMQFIKSIKFPGESYIWNFAIGNDGRIYGGTYPHAKLGALNMDSYEIETFDSPTVKENMYLRYVFPTADGRILCTYIAKEIVTVIFDPKTKQFSPVPKELNGLSSAVIWEGYLCTRNKVYDGVTLALLESLPFPKPPNETLDWSILPGLSNATTLYLRQGQTIYRYTKDMTALELVAELDSRLVGSVRATSRTGKLLGIIGQKYFVITPGNQKMEIRPFPVETAGRPPMFLKSDGKGRIWGGPEFGQTLFWVDTKTKKYVNTDVVSSHGGEVYDVTFYQGKVYPVAYAGGEVIEYDPEKPFDLWNGNPRTIARFGPEYIRPYAGIKIGPDNKLYSGWWIKYGGYGGAISITDPITGKSELIKNPLGQMNISGIAVNDKYIFVGTTLMANGLPNNPDGNPAFGMVDISSREVMFTQEFDRNNFVTVHDLVVDVKTGLVAFAVDKQLYLFNPKNKQFVKLNPELPAVTGTIIAPGDGYIYFGSANRLVKFSLISRKVTDSVEFPENVNKIAMDVDGTIYVSCRADLFRCTIK
ncbi:MAG: hypothetical protein N3A72_07180 [bacterium]|nr:hypothetical protein [bacterium]